MKYTSGYIEDIRDALNANPIINSLAGKSIVVTGGGGLIGSAIVDILIEANRQLANPFNIFIAARNKKKIENRYGLLLKNPCVHFLPYDALSSIDWDSHYDYIIHAASPANPALYIKEPVEVLRANIFGLYNILEYAKKYSVSRVLYVSSGEIYGKKNETRPYMENDYGYLDILTTRACYPSAKRASETLCIAHMQEYGTDVVIARPGNTYGPSATISDNRATNQFARNIINNEDIVMKSSGDQIRTFCYSIDCATAILTILAKGQSGNAYNISNPCSEASIREFAMLMAEIGKKQVIFETASDSEKKSYNMMDDLRFDSSKLKKLGWQGVVGLEKGIRHTLEAIE